MAARTMRARKLSIITEQDVAFGAPEPGANVLEVEQHLASLVPNTGKDPFLLLGKDIHCHILSFLLCLKEGEAPPAKDTWELYSEANLEETKIMNQGLNYFQLNSIMEGEFQCMFGPERAGWDKLAAQDLERFQKEDAAFVTPTKLLKTCIYLSLVSKRWMEVVGDMMNASAPVEVISPQNLFQLKCRALSLNLEPICQDFLDNVRERWGSQVIEKFGKNVCALDVLIDHFAFGSEECFCELVAGEYAHFLIVRCVETLTFHKAYRKESPIIQKWKERCHPSPLVDMFWHSHMSSPKKYARDCNLLLGALVGDTKLSINNIIDHDAGYESMNFFPGSDYESKKKSLFEFEKHLLRTVFYFGRFGGRGTEGTEVLFTEWFNVRKVASEVGRGNIQGYD